MLKKAIWYHFNISSFDRESFYYILLLKLYKTLIFF